MKIGYVYDDNNRLSAIEIPDIGRVTVNSYKWNRPAKVTLPGGSQIDLTYDPLMRLKSKVVKDATQNILMNYGYEYSPSSNITQKSTENGDYDYLYDELYRLINATNPVLDDESFVYDLLGNRLPGNFDANNALLSNDEASFEYDLNGNLVWKTVGGDVVDFVYDVDNRLVQVVGVAEYGYDPFGRRIWKDVGGVRTFFGYSDEGLVGEFDESGIEIKGYGWKPDSTWSTNPLFLKVIGSYFWFQNDHLGTPQKIVDGQGNVVWEAVYSAFGEARVDVELVESNLRFAGQYFDSETGLHYNWWRFYDPELGRYLRSDPIGLSGGINGYVYVENNPLYWVDPTGECAGICTGIGIGVGIGGRALFSYFTRSTAVGIAAWGVYNLQDLQDMVDDLNNRADSDGISVPVPPKNKGRYTCICRVQADGRSEKNCTNNDKKFAYGYGEGPTLKIAKRAAEKMAKQILGATSTHHPQCRCTDPKGQPIRPHG